MQYGFTATVHLFHLREDKYLSRQRKWKPGFLTWLIAVLAVTGTAILLYPTAAAWVTSYNQSKIVERISSLLDEANPDAAVQLAQAREYNAALTSGVELLANANVPTGSGALNTIQLDYSKILSATDDGLMARLKIQKIGVDLPIYHGTTDDVLLRGAGHLEGSHLPVGGQSTHSVITAHRGLAKATMFTNLDHVKTGDTFTVEVFGEVLTYRVRDTRVVQPEDTDSLRSEAGSDLMTLITCTPLGINSHRILVTGERISPTPIADIESAGTQSEVPGLPWWILGMLGATTLAAGYLWRGGLKDAKMTVRSRGVREISEEPTAERY